MRKGGEGEGEVTSIETYLNLMLDDILEVDVKCHTHILCTTFLNMSYLLTWGVGVLWPISSFCWAADPKGTMSYRTEG